MIVLRGKWDLSPDQAGSNLACYNTLFSPTAFPISAKITAIQSLLNSQTSRCGMTPATTHPSPSSTKLAAELGLRLSRFKSKERKSDMNLGPL